jgi:hypothetical protein
MALVEIKQGCVFATCMLAGDNTGAARAAMGAFHGEDLVSLHSHTRTPDLLASLPSDFAKVLVPNQACCSKIWVFKDTVGVEDNIEDQFAIPEGGHADECLYNHRLTHYTTRAP